MPRDPELWLAERLQQHGIDIYAGGNFQTLRDRLEHAIITNRFGPIVAGRHQGKPENYSQLFERMYGCKPRDLTSQHNSNRKVIP